MSSVAQKTIRGLRRFRSCEHDWEKTGEHERHGHKFVHFRCGKCKIRCWKVVRT